MLASELPELKSTENIVFVKDRLQLQLSDVEADEYFLNVLRQNTDNTTIRMNHAFHVFYHGMKS